LIDADWYAYFICMRTTLDLDEKLLEQAQRATGTTGKTAVIEKGLQALIEQAARRRLATLAGTLPRARAPRRRRPHAA
jgi:Arc/MetJ family transcription regulator